MAKLTEVLGPKKCKKSRRLILSIPSSLSVVSALGDEVAEKSWPSLNLNRKVSLEWDERLKAASQPMWQKLNRKPKIYIFRISIFPFFSKKTRPWYFDDLIECFKEWVLEI